MLTRADWLSSHNCSIVMVFVIRYPDELIYLTFGVEVRGKHIQNILLLAPNNSLNT
jgi:hypothetical protein